MAGYEPVGPWPSGCNFACSDDGQPTCGTAPGEGVYLFERECIFWIYACQNPSQGNSFIFSRVCVLQFSLFNHLTF